MPSVTEIELELHNADEIGFGGSLHLPSYLLSHPSVFKFNLGKDRHKIIASFLGLLHMPHLQALFISINFERMGGSESESTKLLYDLSIALLPAHLSNPRPRGLSLSYELRSNEAFVLPEDFRYSAR